MAVLKQEQQDTAVMMRQMVESFYDEIGKGITFEVDQTEVSLILDSASSNPISDLRAAAFELAPVHSCHWIMRSLNELTLHSVSFPG